MKKFGSFIFGCLSLLMMGLAFLLSLAGVGYLSLAVIRLLFSLLFGGFAGLLHDIQGIIKNEAGYIIFSVVAIVFVFVCQFLEEKFDDIAGKLDPYKPRETPSTSGSTLRSDRYEYTFPDYEPEPSAPIDHDALDAVQHAIWITETYGDDWKGYDPEAPDPTLDTYSKIDI